MYRIIVCDDNVAYKDTLVMMLKKYTDLYDAEIIGFSNGRKMLEYCSKNGFDIIYLDIELGEDNGMDYAKTIKKMNPKALIIYISAYDNYYVDMVQAEPFRFIQKDSSDLKTREKRIADTLEEAMKRIRGNDLFSFTYRKERYNIELSNIRYFRSIGRKIYISGETGGTPGCFYGKIDEVERILIKQDENFIRINKSYIVNMKHSAMVAGKNQVKVSDKFLPVTEKYREDAKKRFKAYWIM